MNNDWKALQPMTQNGIQEQLTALSSLVIIANSNWTIQPRDNQSLLVELFSNPSTAQLQRFGRRTRRFGENPEQQNYSTCLLHENHTQTITWTTRYMGTTTNHRTLRATGQLRSKTNWPACCMRIITKLPRELHVTWICLPITENFRLPDCCDWHDF